MNAWYRQPWPWLLISGPAAVLVAGAITTWIAFASADGLVADDYYKQGMAINRVLASEANAAALGLSAEVRLTEETISVQLRGTAPQAVLPPLPAGRWHVVIEDPRASWRIVKETP